jgi:metallophosphoesterase superfamily enzyme
MIHWLDEGTRDEPFVFRHDAAGETEVYALTGHLHPVVCMYGRGRDRLTLPVFWFRQNYAVLPAFGSFTGGYRIYPYQDDRVYAVVPDAVIPVAMV